MTAVAVVGLGAMGSRIAARLLDGGHDVVVWNRTAGKRAALLELGALAAATPAEAAARAELLITMVADPAALHAVVSGRHGVAAGAHRDLLVIEMSTVGPAAIGRVREALPRAVALVDAPVLGSIAEAQAGTLTIFAGGPAAAVERAGSLLAALGPVRHVGALGAGAAAKLVVNAALFGSLVTLGEALALGRGLGLSDETLFELLAVTPVAEQAARRRDAIEDGRYPPRFALALARKDAELISDAARAATVELRVAEAARRWLADAEAAGSGSRDYTAVLAAILGRPRPASGHGGAYDGLIVDLDGVVRLGDRPVEGAAEAIATLRAAGTRIVFLTNDPQSSRAEQAARLTAIGIPATAADVVSSAAATAAYLASRYDPAKGAVLVLGADALRVEIEQAGFTLVPLAGTADAALVVVGGHDGFDYAELRAATAALRRGAPLYATGRDPVVPGAAGLEPATGAILAAVETAGGATATVLGKPEPYIFRLALDALGECRRVAVVGDNLAADIAGARRAGLDSILVLTGAADADDLERSAVHPDVVVPSIVALATQRPA